MEKKKGYSAPALEKGLDIIECLAREETGLSQVEIARALDRSVGEIFRMLVVLEDRGYITQDPVSDRYALTTLLFEVAHRVPRIRRVASIARPVMRALATQTGQSVHLSVVSGHNVLVAAQVDSPGNHLMTVRPGAMVDLWNASSGRVILAHLPEAELVGHFQTARPAGVSEADLRRELLYIRDCGYQMRDSFVVHGVVNIAAPIFDHSGHAIAAMTIPYIRRLQPALSVDLCLAHLLRATVQLSGNLGAAGRQLPSDAQEAALLASPEASPVTATIAAKPDVR